MSDAEYIIRPGGINDLDALYQIDKKCFDSDIAFDRELFEYFLSLERKQTFILEVKNIIAAFVMVQIPDLEYDDEAIGQILTIDVLPDHRRRGYGEILMKHAEEMFKESGVDTVYLCVAENNQSAIKLYEKIGYLKNCIVEGYYRDDLNAVCMIKELG